MTVAKRQVLSSSSLGKAFLLKQKRKKQKGVCGPIPASTISTGYPGMFHLAEFGGLLLVICPFLVL